MTIWSKSLSSHSHRYIVCTGGGGGTGVEAANRGASDAGGRTVGLNIGLPQEQRPNSVRDPRALVRVSLLFHESFWFAHLARALVVFPGGFGQPDELTEILDLDANAQVELRDPGSSLWVDLLVEVIHFDALVRHAG